MDYILTLNEKIRSFEEYYANKVNIINNILFTSKELLDSIHEENVTSQKINKLIKELQESMTSYKRLKKETFIKEGELKDISVRITRDYPGTNPKELIDLDHIKNSNQIDDLYNKLINLCKLSKSLEFISLIIKKDNILKEIDLSYIELISEINELIKELSKSLSDSMQSTLKNTYPFNKEYKEDNISLLQPYIKKEKVKEKKVEKPNKESTIPEQQRKIIIENREFNQSIEKYEEYLANKYKSVNYKVEYEGIERKPYPHELKLRYFTNDKNERIYISKNYAEEDYYEKTYLPYIRQKNIPIHEMVEKIEDIKSRIYETIARTIISKDKSINEDTFIKIIEYLVGNDYTIENYVRYNLEKDNNNYNLNIYFNGEKITVKLDYKEFMKTYDSIYKERLPRNPIFNSQTVQHTDTSNSTIYTDTTYSRELSPEDRKRITKAYIFNKLKIKKWQSGERYKPVSSAKEELALNFYANSKQYTINLEKAGIQRVL